MPKHLVTANNNICMLHWHSESNFIFQIIIVDRFMPILQIRKLKVKKLCELRSSDFKSCPYSSLPPQQKATGESNSAFWELLRITLVCCHRRSPGRLAPLTFFNIHYKLVQEGVRQYVAPGFRAVIFSLAIRSSENFVGDI